VLKQPAYQDRKIALAGFSDAKGRPARNLALSRERAQAVALALRQRGVTKPEAVGFGAAAPVACDDTPQGLEKNRRVEVWVR
jgi:phosphate transport system substrate-binding protein